LETKLKEAESKLSQQDYNNQLAAARKQWFQEHEQDMLKQISNAVNEARKTWQELERKNVKEQVEKAVNETKVQITTLMQNCWDIAVFLLFFPLHIHALFLQMNFNVYFSQCPSPCFNTKSNNIICNNIPREDGVRRKHETWIQSLKI